VATKAIADALLAGVPPPRSQTFASLISCSRSVTTTNPALRREFPQLQRRTLEDWLRDEGWAGRRAGAVKRDKMGRPLRGAAAAGPLDHPERPQLTD
jgi:hypothetical protein